MIKDIIFKRLLSLSLCAYPTPANCPNIAVSSSFGILCEVKDIIYESRVEYAKSQILDHKIRDSCILVTDKMLQKVMLFENINGKINLKNEFDCSTGRNGGNKIKSGDNRTPEGRYYVKEIIPSANLVYDGLKVYGGYFLRLHNSIGMHGNGTDTFFVKNWKNDPAYSIPQPLGIFAENYGYGLSHGCIRLDNKVLRELVHSKALKINTPVLIY
jgi:hypothetical protein